MNFKDFSLLPILKEGRPGCNGVKMYFLIAALAVVLGLAAYHRITSIRFADNRGHISGLYCRLLSPAARLERPVILIPGTKGSILESGGRTVWLAMRQLLPGGEPLLYGEGESDVRATDVLSRVTVIPGIAEFRPYFRMASALACGRDTYFFAYDWRKNPAEHADALGALIERVTGETGKKPSIIAHSMGGLITHYYMKRHADAVDRVAYVGVPFRPGLSFLEDIDKGSPTGLNRTILSAEALFSHPGSFALLPHQGSRLYRGQDLMDENTWKENGLSAYAQERDPETAAADDARLSENLQKAQEFFAELDRPSPMANRFMFVVGSCRDTLYSIGEDRERVFRPGDGRVPEDSAYPVETTALEKTVHVSCAVHHKQLNDRQTVDAILKFLE